MNNNEDSLSSDPKLPLDDTHTENGDKPHLTPVPKRQRSALRLLLLISITLALLVLIVAYVYWYQNPKKVVSDAVFSALSAESVNYTGQLQTTGAMKMNTVLNGGVSSDGAAVNAKFVFDTQNKKYTLTGDGLLNANNDVYIKVKDIDELIGNYRSAIPATSLPLFDKIIDKIDDKWIKISADDIKSFNSDFAAIQRCSGVAINKIQNDSTTKSTLLDLYEKNPFVEIDKSLGVKGDSLGYALKINHELSKSFTTDYKKTAFYRDLVKCDSSYMADDDVAKSIAADSGTSMHIWVSKWSHVLTKVEVRDDSRSSKTNLSIDTTFNQPVTIAVPKDATTLEKLQDDVQGLLQSAQSN